MRSSAQPTLRRMTWILMFGTAVTLPWLSGCGKKKESAKSSSETNEAKARKGEPGDETQQNANKAARPPDSRGAPDGGAAGPPVKLNLSKDSPTGLKECDEYLKKVCECAGKDPALKITCEAAKRSAPKWKQSAMKDPQSIPTVRGSCVQAMKAIRASFKTCK